MSATVTGLQKLMWLQMFAVQCCSIFTASPVLLLGLSMQTAARALVLKEGEQWGDCRSDGGCNGVDLYCYGSHNVCVKCEESACRQFHDIWSVCQKSICRGIVEPPVSSSSLPRVPRSSTENAINDNVININANQPGAIKSQGEEDDGVFRDTVWVILITTLFLVIIVVVVVILTAMFFGKDISRRMHQQSMQEKNKRLVHTNSVSSQTDSEASSDASFQRSVSVCIPEETVPLNSGQSN